MGHSTSYPPARLTDLEVELLRERLIDMLPRLEVHQLTALGDFFYDAARERVTRGDSHRVDLHA